MGRQERMQSGRLDLGTWSLTPDWVSAYRTATGDAAANGIVPPLALAARALAGLLDELKLPGGAVHGSQEVECHRAAFIGDEVSIVADVGRPSQRGDFCFIVAAFQVSGIDKESIVTGKCTVILPRGIVDLE